MKSDTPLDYAVFQLSPKRSRCELFISRDGSTEKLASGLVKPFVTHLKVAEEQVALSVQSIKLEIERHKNAGDWFTKGTLERFVRFVSTPEVLEMVNTFDAEMSQLEAARIIYSQGPGDQRADAQGGDGTGTMAAPDATKKELLRAIDVRLTAVRQDLITACARASAAGFNPDTVSELQHFADQFGAHRLNEACTKFTSLYQRRPDLIITSRKLPRGNDTTNNNSNKDLLRSSVGSDMSIDDTTEDQSGPIVRPNQRGPSQAQSSNQPNPSTWQQQQPMQFAATEEEEAKGVADEKKEEAASTTESLTPITQPPARRLSVQDRINLFENKQKETSGGGSATGSGGVGGGGGKPVVGKSVELRRLSSDVAAAERSVLRRWSGASDMSIEKDTESPLCTPSSIPVVSKSNALSVASEDKDRKGLNNNNHPEGCSLRFGDVELKAQDSPQARVDEETTDSNVPTNWKDQAAFHDQLRPSSAIKQVVKNDQGFSSQETSVSAFNEERSYSYKDQASSEAHLRGPTKQTEGIGANTQVVTSDVKLSRREDGGKRNLTVLQSLVKGSHSRSQSLSGQFEGGIGLQHKDGFSGELEGAVKKGSSFSSKQQMKVEDSDNPNMNHDKLHPAGKSHRKGDGTRAAYEHNKLNLSGKEHLESQGIVHVPSIAPSEQVQRIRQSKGNQGLNDELKLKADELEKLFAEHKLRVPGRIESADTYVEQAVKSQCKEAADSTPQLPSRNTTFEPTRSSSYSANSDVMSLVKMVDNHNYSDALRKCFSDLNFGDDSRGKFYEKYMQKRDAKLRDEWNSNRAEKEARLKAMEDSLEWSRAEMKAKFSGSKDRNSSVPGAHRHAGKFSSFKTNVKGEQHPIASLQNEEDEDLSEASEEKLYGQAGLVSESVIKDDDSLRHSKKNFPNRTMYSSVPRPTASSTSRPAAKVVNSNSGRRRDNPLAQSVPNFSDLRKENTKPSSGGSKTTTRAQVRNNARSKSTYEEIPGFKEEKPKRSQSSQKSSASTAEFKDLSSLNSDGGAGSSAAWMQASMASVTQKNEEFDEVAFEADDSADIAKDEDRIKNMAVADFAYTSNGKVRLSEESEKSGSEIGDSTRSLAQGDPVSVAETPTAVPSILDNVGSVHDSPIESPVSWNSRTRNPFSYPHEPSDIDAYMDSPIGSPASWNSHSHIQGESDVARMRKKWGSAQKPILVSTSSNNQSRKDVTKGFKRLLKFGRKNRGSESLVPDWISATTSEGDDDTEDGRDPANRLSEDLRKSRMGFSYGLSSDDNFNESELFSEHVQSLQSSIPAPPAHFKLRDDHISGSSLKAPRSFFSLSTFRSKGSDTKPR